MKGDQRKAPALAGNRGDGTNTQTVNFPPRYVNARGCFQLGNLFPDLFRWLAVVVAQGGSR